MPFAHRIHPSLGLAVFRFWGAMSVAQGTKAFLDYFDDPAFNRQHVMVTDGRMVNQVEADLTRILYNVANLIPKIRTFPAQTRSIVIVPDEMVLSHIRMVQKALSWTSSITMLTTFSPDEAMDMAGHPGLALEPLLPEAAQV